MPLPTLLTASNLLPSIDQNDPNYAQTKMALDKYRPIDYILDWFKRRIPGSGIPLNQEFTLFDKVLILKSSTGSGKSTVLPPMLYKTFLHNTENEKTTMVICCQPRVLTAKENRHQYGVGPYGKAKILAEEICLEFRRKGMCVPILRPKSFIGPERLGVFALFYDWAKDGKGFPMIGSGKNRYQLLDVEDLCEAIFITMTADAGIANETFNIGAKEFTTMKEHYEVVLGLCRFRQKNQHVSGMADDMDASLSRDAQTLAAV